METLLAAAHSRHVGARWQVLVFSQAAYAQRTAAGTRTEVDGALERVDDIHKLLLLGGEPRLQPTALHRLRARARGR